MVIQILNCKIRQSKCRFPIFPSQYFADVRILDGQGRSALWHAKSAGSKECADILRHNGCNDLGTMIPQGSDVFC